jgi:subtilisin family serine protease
MTRRIRTSYSTFFSITLLFISSLEGIQAFGDDRERRPGHILYQLKEDANPSQRAKVQKILENRKGRLKKTLRMSGKVELASLITDNSTEEAIAEELLSTGAVEYAEPDYRVYPVDTPNDPGISKQWHHSIIRTFEAWKVTPGSKNILVTVCDTGVDAQHVDLSGAVVQPGFNTTDGSRKSSPVNLHGTAVAGLIAAKANNRLGIAGIAPLVKILPVRVTNDSQGGAYLSDLAECIRYGADAGAKVHNVSFTGSESQTINSAAKYARSKGSLLFMAAGNQGKNISSTQPDYNTFILVGGTDKHDQHSSFSNYGLPVHLVAPGTNVYTTAPGNSYTVISGTSFSSPIAAAVGALVYAINPIFTPDDVQNILYQSADSLGNSLVFGYGRLNAEAAVSLAQKWVPSSSK